MPYYPSVAAHWWDGSDYRPVEFLGDPTPPTQAPSVPTGLDFTATSNSITLTWTPSTPGAGDGIDFYRVRRNGVVLSAQPGTPTFTDTGRSPSTNYTYEVQAVPDSGMVNASAWSAPLTATTLGTPPSTAPKFGLTVGGNLGGISGWANTYPASVALLGLPRVYRAYRSNSTLPTSWASWTAPNDKNMLYVVSWKPDHAALMAGNLDSVINTF